MVFYLSGILYAMLILSVILGMSQASFIGVWLSMELNMILFVSVLVMSKEGLQSSAMKYFIIQGLGSMMLVYGIVLASSGMSIESMIIMSVAVLLKLGLAPVHMWFIKVMSDLDWSSFFWGSTVQKILPVYMFWFVTWSGALVMIIFSVIMSVMGGVLSLKMKQMLAYSSIFMNVWILSVSSSLALAIEYLLVYSFSLMMMIMIMSSSEKIHMMEIFEFSKMAFWSLALAFLSMSGLPPFLGFFMKLEVFFEIISLNSWGFVMMLLVGSMAFVYIYMRFFFSLLSESGQLPVNEKLMDDSPVMGLLLIFSVIYPWLYMYGCKA